MALKNVVIHGVRSYGIKRKIDFSIPDGINPGSGLNIFLGPNNGGKSTIIELLDYLNKDNNHVTENVYNKNCNGFIISAQTTDDYIFRLQSNSLGAAICKKNNHRFRRKKVPFATGDTIEVSTSKIKVYYTDYSIKKVEKATKNELENIIKKSYLMCESK